MGPGPWVGMQAQQPLACSPVSWANAVPLPGGPSGLCTPGPTSLILGRFWSDHFSRDLNPSQGLNQELIVIRCESQETSPKSKSS